MRERRYEIYHPSWLWVELGVGHLLLTMHSIRVTSDRALEMFMDYAVEKRPMRFRVNGGPTRLVVILDVERWQDVDEEELLATSKSKILPHLRFLSIPAEEWALGKRNGTWEPPEL